MNSFIAQMTRALRAARMTRQSNHGLTPQRRGTGKIGRSLAISGLLACAGLLSPAWAETPAPIIDGAIYRFAPLNAPNLSMEVQSASTSNGANVQLGTPSDTALNQQWEAVAISAGVWQFEPQQATSMRLNTTGTVTNSNVTQATGSTSNNQRWTATANSDGSYSFAPVSASGLRLNVQGGVTTPGANVNVSTSNGSNSQHWKLTARPGTYKPSASTTGVRPGVALTVVNGNASGLISLTTAGATYVGQEFHGSVHVEVANVTFRNCKFCDTTSYSGPLVLISNAAASNILFEDCTFAPQVPFQDYNAIAGHHFTARRCDISLTTDGLQISNSHDPDGAIDVHVEACYIHDLVFWSPSTTNSDHKTHNDGAQVMGGANIYFVGNYITGLLSSAYGNPSLAPAGLQSNSALMIQPLVGHITNLNVLNNWIGGGAVSVNFSNTTSFDLGTVGQVSYNYFGRNQVYQGDPALPDDSGTITMPANCICTTTGNVYEDNGHAVVVRNNW